jgi:hypothetical protein
VFEMIKFTCSWTPLNLRHQQRIHHHIEVINIICTTWKFSISILVHCLNSLEILPFDKLHLAESPSMETMADSESQSANRVLCK